MLLSQVAANSYFTCCESDREESVIDSTNDDGNDNSDYFETENKRPWSRTSNQEQSKSF